MTTATLCSLSAVRADQGGEAEPVTTLCSLAPTSHGRKAVMSPSTPAHSLRAPWDGRPVTGSGCPGRCPGRCPGPGNMLHSATATEGFSPLSRRDQPSTGPDVPDMTSGGSV